MTFHAHSTATRFGAEQPDHSRHWVLAMIAMSAASWVVTIGAVRLLAAVL